MRNLRAHLVALVMIAPAVACGGSDNGGVDAKPADAPITVHDSPHDAPPPIDAPPDAEVYDFNCAGSASPTTTLATTITVSGTVESINGTSPGPGSGVTVELLNNTQTVDSVTTGSDGTFTFQPQTTGGNALDLTVRATKTGNRPDNVIPPAALIADQPNVPVLSIANATWDEIAQLGAGTTQGSGQGALGLQVVDCAGTPVGGATLSVQQGGSDVGTQFDAGALAAQAKGTVIVFSVPPGATTIVATYMSQVFRTRTLTSVADETTTTQLRP